MRNNSVYCLNGLYDRYHDAYMMYYTTHDKTYRNKAIRLAKTIRDLPWSEKYVEDKNMNNENYIVINGKKAELTEEQLKQLGIEVNEDKRWRGEYKDEYWYVATNGVIVYNREDNFGQDNFRYDTHNYFQTSKEAREYAEVLEIKRQLMKFADKHNEEIDWDDGSTSKYYLGYNYKTCDLTTGWSYRDKMADIIYFTSREIAEQAIDTIGKDNIIKYLIYNY